MHKINKKSTVLGDTINQQVIKAGNKKIHRTMQCERMKRAKRTHQLDCVIQ
jgi:hypothetical protein